MALNAKLGGTLVAEFTFGATLLYCAVALANASSDGTEDSTPEDKLALDPELSDGTEPEPLSVEPEAEEPTGAPIDDENPLLAGAAIREETLLT